MSKNSIEHLPKEIQKVVLKARASAALVPKYITNAIDAEQKANIAEQRAISGEKGFKVSPWKQGCVYSGEWGKTVPNGYGVLNSQGQYGNYYGQWKNGFFQGTGVFIYSANKLSLKYAGSFWRDLMHGAGIYEWKQGNKWIGEMKQDSIRGYGIFEWANGNVFEGYKGTMDKKVYYSNDKDRFGVEWQANGDEPKIGRWDDGIFIQLD